MAPDGVEAIICRRVKNLDQLKQIVPEVIVWLKEKLPLASKDKELKARLKKLLGDDFFVPNLKHLGIWDDLIEYCESEATKMGEEMQTFFEEKHLGSDVLIVHPPLNPTSSILSHIAFFRNFL